ncbi:PKD domain-containing protein [Streptomyces sp. G1]|uniref:PKD domain-containing protein n=1 Tax=Streptomyces sp. G1 TaxID=361572 RepID=UPI00203055A4|nr:PKD domain-containing protein [Streptomyces sp. G1]MCM1975747.1 PKD domain-containing protein [Streptomyces sp. G1]
MRTPRTAVLLTAGLVTLLGIPAVAAADTPTDRYVNSASGACSDTRAGSRSVPFCSISAAAKVVEPGGTVWIEQNTSYPDEVTIDRSGEPGKPITFAVRGSTFRSYLAKGLTLDGASHVVIRGLQVGGSTKVVRSGDIELDRLNTKGDADREGLVVGEGSTNVRVTRSDLTGVRIDGGARGTVLGRNSISGLINGTAVTVADAPGTAVTNNTFVTTCEAALAVSGASAGSSVHNNVFFTWDNPRCTSPAPRTGIQVAADAAAGVRADYNLITGPVVKMAPYTWAGTAYPTPAAFTAATGQGAHDLLAPNFEAVGPKDRSPTIDSGDPTAPGVLPTDYYGKPTADDPRVANTGKDGGYIDRGAYETQDVLSGVGLSVTPSWAPTGTKVRATAAPRSTWPSELTYHYDFGDGTAPVVTTNTTAEHVYAKPGDHVARVKAVNKVGASVFSSDTPVKATQAGALTTDFTVDQPLPTEVDPGAMPVSPLTVVIDPAKLTAAPWPVVSATVEFGDGNASDADRLRSFEHIYTTPGTYTIKLTLVDSKGAKSTATRTVKVAYAPSGYIATEPFRIKDSRTDGEPVTSGRWLHVILPEGHRVPGHALSNSMASAVVNVTVTGATEDTHLTVWPSGQERPATSNVNVRAGGTSSNTVTVPVGWGLMALLNSGKADLIVDFVGYYQPNAGDRFSPLAPTRVLDTRTTGGALAAAKTRTVKVAGVNGVPADATAVALNLTGTGAKEPAHVIAYPDPAKRPATSNLNVEPGKDKSNQVIVPVGPNGTITLFTNTGSTHVILDAVGYYGKDGKALFTPVVPKRLADTRTTGKVAPGATTTVSGLPAGAVGAVLNVTATDTTAPGFLTAYGSGGTLPGASSLNTLPGRTVPNHVMTPVGPGGKVSIFNSYGGPNHVITDLLGYFTTG